MKVDASYMFPLSSRSSLLLAGRFRALSGTPRTAAGDNDLLLPRGALGRIPAASGLDLRAAYRRAVGKGVTAEVFADVFNVLDRQSVASVDETYTTYPIGRGIDGGEYQDLIWLDGVRRNPRFGRPTERYAPVSAQIGARVRF